MGRGAPTTRGGRTRPRARALAAATSLAALLQAIPMAAAPANPKPGRVFLLSGSSGLLIRSIDAPDPSHRARFGSSLASAGDVDGDTVPDLAVGAPGLADGSLEAAGRAYLFSGATGALLRTIPPPAPAKKGRFGWSLAGPGDVNGDLIGDLVIGSPGARLPGAGRAGQAYVISGADGSLLATLTAPSPRSGSRFGSSLAAGGDMTGDGLAEIAVGAPLEASGGRSREGKVYLFNPSGAHLVTFDHPLRQQSALFGESLSYVPDADGDGIDDLAVGADGQHISSGDYSGAAFVMRATDPNAPLVAYRTPPSVAAQANFGFALAGVADLDGDGRGDLVVTAPDLDGAADLSGGAFAISGAADDPNAPVSPALRIIAELPDPEPGKLAFFGGSVAPLPDLTADGLPEVILGAELHRSPSGVRTGRAYILEAVDGTPVHILPSPTGDSCARFGWAVAPAGDVDGDTVMDVAVGAPYHRVTVDPSPGSCL